MLSDWLIKLKRSIINVLLQIVYFKKVFNVTDIECFMYPSMFSQFNVYNIVEEPGWMYFPGTLELSTFISKLLCWFSCDIGTLSLTKSLPENLKFVNFWDVVPRFLRLYINDCFCLQQLNFTITLPNLLMWWQKHANPQEQH